MTYSNWTQQTRYLSTLGFCLNCVSENLVNTVLNQCKIIFSSLHLSLVFQLWVFTFWNLSPEGNCSVALTEFLHGFSCMSISFMSRADKFVTKGWLTGPPSPTTLTLNGFTRNEKPGFNSCKWSNLFRNTSSIIEVYLFILPLCVLKLPLREKHSFSFWHSENDRMFQFCSGNIRSQCLPNR